MLVGEFSSGGVALFADDEEETGLHAEFAQAQGGGDLRGDDAFCVAGAAAVNELIVLAGGDERRDGIDVGGEDDVGGVAWIAGKYIEALAGGAAFAGLLDFDLFDREAVLGEEACQKCADSALVVGDGLDVDQAPRELNGIETHEAPEYPRRNGRMRGRGASYNGY